jgi:hypothetical protein
MKLKVYFFILTLIFSITSCFSRTSSSDTDVDATSDSEETSMGSNPNSATDFSIDFDTAADATCTRSLSNSTNFAVNNGIASGTSSSGNPQLWKNSNYIVNGSSITTNTSVTITSQPSTDSQTRCVGGHFTPITIGVTGAVSNYQWYSNTVQSTIGGTLLNGATAYTYTPSSTSEGTLYYYCIVDPVNGSDVTSEVSGAFITLALNQGMINNEGETICNGSTPTMTIGSDTDASGGDNTITYSWRSSANNFNADIPGATGATYLPSAVLTTTRSYRRYAIVGTCNTEPIQSSRTWVVTVHNAFKSGAISAGQTTCSGGTPSIIESTTPASGGDGTITYSWRSSADGYATAIPDATSATYTPPTDLTTTTSYRRYAKDGTCTTEPTVSSGTWTVNFPTITVDENYGPKDITICIGAGSWQDSAIRFIVTAATNVTCTGLPEGFEIGRAHV